MVEKEVPKHFPAPRGIRISSFAAGFQPPNQNISSMPLGGRGWVDNNIINQHRYNNSLVPSPTPSFSSLKAGRWPGNEASTTMH